MKKNNEQRITILITGLSGIGKSRLAHRVQVLLGKDGITQGILRECGTVSVDVYTDERDDAEVQKLITAAEREGQVVT